MITRRHASKLILTAAGSATLLRAGAAAAAEQTVRIGISMSFTGADAESAARAKNGAMLAIDEANASGKLKGFKFEALILDDGTATAGQYDPAQAATNARKMVSDKGVVAAIGPQMSGAGKAMAPILSQGNLAIITPASTNPDITDPKFAAQYRPAGKAIYFRTVTTDAYQGPNMANFMVEKLGAKQIFVLDDSGAYGVGMADAFQREAEKKGIKVVGRDRLDPKAADYTSVLTKIKALGGDSIYYGGVNQAFIKLAKQSYDIVPGMIKGGGDGIVGADTLAGVGFPAVEGWYATIASPYLMTDGKVEPWIKRFQAKYNMLPDNYSFTSYDAALVIIDAVTRVAATGKEVTRDAVRDAIQSSNVDTLQGKVSFDENGDIRSKVVSVLKITHDKAFPDDDVVHQYKYVGSAPEA
jgi:branched-chain amino acid transport system substrate-binding protein